MQQAHTQTKAANVRFGAQEIKTESETAPSKCAEIKGIKSHEAPAAVREEGAVRSSLYLHTDSVSLNQHREFRLSRLPFSLLYRHHYLNNLHASPAFPFRSSIFRSGITFYDGFCVQPGN